MRMNREILRIAIPNIISNVTVPLMGLVSTGIAGRWGDSAQTIGALAIGVSIFNFIYWNCSFIRMGTSGLTAQAFGAGNMRECAKMLVRAMAVSLVVGVAVLALQYPIGEFSLRIMNGGEMSRDYFYARVWAVPAAMMLFGINGWFTGMQNAIIPMCTSITVNLLHILCSLWFAFGFDMGIVGIAYASVAAQYFGILLSFALLAWRYREVVRMLSWDIVREAVAPAPMRDFFRINSDIIIRNFCNVAVYTFFTAASARMGSDLLLAVNTILMQLFTMFSYMSDGFAFAAEALAGRFIGAMDPTRLRDCIRKCMGWAVAIAVLYIGIYIGWWQELISLFVGNNDSNLTEIIACAGDYIGWVIAIPLIGAIPFMLDGVMVGATLTKVMRNTMLISTAAHFALYFSLRPTLGNTALWLAFVSYLLLRGVCQYLLSRRLEAIYDKAESPNA